MADAAALLSSAIAAGLAAGLARRMLAGLHVGQRRVIWHRRGERLSRRVALLTYRRWGKTLGVLLYAVAMCLAKPGTSVLYVTLSKDSALEIAWPVLIKIRSLFGLTDKHFRCDPPLERTTTQARVLRATFANGSVIRFVGADQPRFARMLRGQEHDLVIVDEAQDFNFIDLAYLIRQVLGPTLTDRRGRLFMCGTPGPAEMGFFWEVTVKRKHSEWDVVLGEFEDNHHNLEERRDEIAAMKLANPDIEQEPWVQREHLGLWVPDNRQLMVTLRPELNYLREWEPAADDLYVLGIDWGWWDASAYVLGTWNPRRHNKLVYLEAWDQPEMRLEDHLKAIARYRSHEVYGRNLRIICDPAAGKKAQHIVEQLRGTYQIPLENADKTDKAYTVAQIDMEASLGQIQVYNVLDPAHPELNGMAQQWRVLMWQIDPRTNERTEGAPRHRHDAALYVRRAVALEAYRPKETVVVSEEQRLYVMKLRRAKARHRRMR